jgi:hypothetical protein
MKWTEWLDEFITTPYGDIPRRTMLHRFVRYGLKPLVEAHGYRWAKGINDIQSALATGLYLNHEKPLMISDWTTIPTYTGDAIQEDADQFNLIFTWDVWDPFWSTWGSWEDVATDTNYGADRRIDIQAFIWGQLDLHNSAQTQVVDEFIDDGNDHDESERRRRHDDVYIRDSAESGEWGGYRR